MKAKINHIENKKYPIKYIILSLMPILALYEFIPLINVGYFSLIMVITGEIISKKETVKVNIPILALMLLFMILNLVVGMSKYSDLTSSLTNTSGMALFTLLSIFLLNRNYLNREKFYSSCKLIGIIATAFLFYQFIMFYFQNTIVSGQIPFLEVTGEKFKSIEYGRPTSFFYEPAHYAVYLAPIYAMSLIRKEYSVSLIMILGLVFSTSTFGVIIVLIVPFLMSIRSNIQTLVKNFFVILISFSLLIMMSNYFSNRFFERITDGNLTSSLRLFGTIDYLNYLDTLEWFTGVGFNRLMDYSIENNFFAYNYANTYIYIIISFGIIGLFSWLIYNFVIYKMISNDYKVIFFILVLVSLSDQILFNRNLLYLLIWIYAVTDKSIQIEGLKVKIVDFNFNKKMLIKDD